MKENELQNMNDQDNLADLEVQNADEIKGGEDLTIGDEKEVEEAASATTNIPIKIKRPTK